MALNISIYNRQRQTSASGKEYIGYALAFAPGQRGSVSEAAKAPPFYIRDQRSGKQWTRLAARSLDEAKNEALQAQHVLEAVARGVDVAAAGEDSKERLTAKVAAYLAEVESNKSLATWRAYKRSLELFLQSCKRQNVSDIKREDLLAFKTFLKKAALGGRTQYNTFLNTMIFFSWAKHDVNIKKGDWPPKPEREPEEYHQDEIESLLKAAKADERLLLNAFLNSGMRDGEIAHLTYADIDARNSLWMVKPKD